MATAAESNTVIAQAFSDLAIGGDTQPMNRRELFSAIAQAHSELATLAEPGGGGGGGAVTSVFTRTGAVVALTGDYAAFYSVLGHDHDSRYYTETESDARYALVAHTHTFASLTSKPTTIGGFGITDFNSLGDARWSLLSHIHDDRYYTEAESDALYMTHPKVMSRLSLRF